MRRRSFAPGSIAARFGGLGLQHGFVPLPVSLQRHRRRLGLTPALLDLVAVLLSCGRGREHPHPSVAWLAAQLGVDGRTVQRRIGRLVALGHLVVGPRRTTAGRQGANAYDLHPLLTQAEALDTQEADPLDGRPGGVATAPPIVERRDLDTMEVPPTPSAHATDSRSAEEPEGPVHACTPPTGGYLAGGGQAPTEQTTEPGVEPRYV